MNASTTLASSKKAIATAKVDDELRETQLMTRIQLLEGVEAESEEEAINVAMENTTFPEFKKRSESDGEIVGLEMVEQIVGGNVFYGILNKVEASEINI